MRRRQESIARELDNIRLRQQQLESTNERLQEKAVDIRRSLTSDLDLDLTDAQYQQLKLAASQDDVALKDFVAVRTVCTTIVVDWCKDRLLYKCFKYLLTKLSNNIDVFVIFKWSLTLAIFEQ